MKLKFLAVSKDSSFKMDKAKFEEACLDDTVEFEMVPDNTTPLPVLYNKELRKERGSQSYDGLIFMHGDVSFNVKAFVDHLKEVYGKYIVLHKDFHKNQKMFCLINNKEEENAEFPF